MGNKRGRPKLAPAVYDFEDYREFIKARIHYLKTRDKGFSLRKLSNAIAVSPAYLPNVFKGHFPLAEEVFERLLPNLKIPDREVSYLRLLRTVADTIDANERRQAFEKLMKFKGFKEVHKNKLSEYQYLTKWHYVAIRELSNVKGFKREASWIQDRIRPKLSLSEIDEAIEFLTSIGYLGPDGAAPPEKRLALDGPFYKLSIHDFYRQMLELQANSFEEIPRAERTTQGFTVALPSSAFDRVKKVLYDALEEIESISNQFSKNQNEKVYQINVGAFPLSSKQSKSKEKENDAD